MSSGVPVRTCSGGCGRQLAPHEVVWVRREPGRGIENYDAYCQDCAPRAKTKVKP